MELIVSEGVCVCLYLNACVKGVCVHVYKTEVDFGGLPLSLPTYTERQDFSLEPRLADWSSQHAPGIPLVSSTGPRDLNSGVDTFVASAFPDEPSPQVTGVKI